MLTIKDIMNPNLKNKESELILPERTKLRDISINTIQSVIHVYINVTDESGMLVGAVKTERLYYLVLKQKESEFMQILDSMDSGIIAIDRDTRVYYVNYAYARILGVNISKILGRYLSVIEPEASLLDVLKTCKRQYVQDKLVKSVNAYVDTDMHPLIEEGKIVGAFSIFTDVTNINKLHNEVQRITEVAEEYNRQIQAKEILEQQKIIGESKVYLDCVNKALKVAPTDTMVLLRGENGVGKEVISNIIKEKCARSNKPFVTVNCSAIPNSLIESELFGYEEGAFTGASKGGKMGKFQLADGGTLFLDEIGDMPYEMQAKLLRVLQEGEIERVGRQERIAVDVRVIAATNKNLEKMVSEEKFREDLYYRLNVVSIHIPPLRERGEDILILANYFASRMAMECGLLETPAFSSDVQETLLSYTWPGNVRELKNTIERAVYRSKGHTITTIQLDPFENPFDTTFNGGNEGTPQTAKTPTQPKTDVPEPPNTMSSFYDSIPINKLNETKEAIERNLLERALKQANGNQKEAAALMELSYDQFRGLYRKHRK